MPVERVVVVEEGPASKVVEVSGPMGPATRIHSALAGPFRRVILVPAGTLAETVVFVSGGFSMSAMMIEQKSFPDMTNIASQEMFAVTGKVAVVAYAVIGTTAVDTAGTDALLTIGYDLDDDGLAAWDFNVGGPIPVDKVWQGSLPVGDGEYFAPFEFMYLDGHAIGLYKTGADEITQGQMTVFCMWFPLEDGASVTPV